MMVSSMGQVRLVAAAAIVTTFVVCAVSTPAGASALLFLCCDGPGNCPEYEVSCPAAPPDEVTAVIPMVPPETASLSVDPQCLDYKQALIDFSQDSCATITLDGGMKDGAVSTVCFPGPDGGVTGQYQFVSRCDAIQGVCASDGGNPPTVFHNAAGAPFCCTTLGGNEVAGQWCVQTNGFSNFTFGTWADHDKDTHPDIGDNCPNIPNPSQSDEDGDLIGDVCDNCPAVPNQNQLDTTGSSVGDACNCALPGVRVGPTGAPCQATSVPALPSKGKFLLGGLLLGLGGFAAGGGRKLFRRRGEAG